MATPPHDDCLGVPSIERRLLFAREVFQQALPKEVYDALVEIRDLSTQDALEYLMLEKYALQVAIMRLLTIVNDELGRNMDWDTLLKDGFDSMHEFLKKHTN